MSEVEKEAARAKADKQRAEAVRARADADRIRRQNVADAKIDESLGL